MTTDNPFLNDEDEEIQAGSENANFKQLRDYAKKLERQVSTMTKEMEGLRSFKSEAVAEQRKNILTSAGLSEKHAALYLSLHKEDEVTAESIQSFATEYELPLARGEETPAPAETTPEIAEGTIVSLQPEAVPAPKSAGFAPTTGASTPAAAVVSDVADAQRLAVENPAEYARLRAAGRIKVSRLPGSDAS